MNKRYYTYSEVRSEEYLNNRAFNKSGVYSHQGASIWDLIVVANVVSGLENLYVKIRIK